MDGILIISSALIYFFIALMTENGGWKRFSNETESCDKQIKCQDKKVPSVNAILGLYRRRKMVGMFLWEGLGEEDLAWVSCPLPQLFLRDRAESSHWLCFWEIPSFNCWHSGYRQVAWRSAIYCSWMFAGVCAGDNVQSRRGYWQCNWGLHTGYPVVSAIPGKSDQRS